MNIIGILMALTLRLAYISLPLYMLKLMSDRSPITRYYFRLGVYISAMGLCSIWGVIVSIAMTLMGKRYDINFIVSRTFYKVISKVMGITCTVDGEHHLDTRPAVLVGNHQSMLDIVFLGRIFPRRTSVMAKKELQWTPLLGQYMLLSGAVFVDRGSNKNAVAALAAAGADMKTRGISLWMFPEGTRHSSKESDLLPFKKGAFHLAVQAGVPIVPVVCENYWELYHSGVFEPGNFKIKVLPPIPTDRLTTADIPDLITRTRDAMLVALREISGDSIGSDVGSTPVASAIELPETPTASLPNESKDVSGGETEVSEDEGVLVDRPL